MRVPSHQIYNILNIYSNWVSNNVTSSMEKFNGNTFKSSIPYMLADRYRKSIMGKVTGNIVHKITNLESNNQRSHRIAEKLKEYEGKNGRLTEKNEDTFIYNTILSGSEKATNTLFIDKSSFLAK